MEEKKKNIIKDWRLWTVIVILALIIITFFTISNKGTSTSNVYKPGQEIILTNNIKKELYEKVKKDITDDLKTPATATFPKIQEWDMNVNSNNVIEVKSYVDSQNSYGAMLRANFKQKYIILGEEKYLCIYKEFDNEKQFDITDRTENKEVINKNINQNQIDEFMKKTGESLYCTLYNKNIDYSFNEETQQLEWNIKVNSQTEGDLKNNCYLALTATIDECICIPTVNTVINAYTDSLKNERIATINEINFNFMIEDWNILSDIGMNTEHLTTNLEKELGEKLIQDDAIKNMKVDYWNK